MEEKNVFYEKLDEYYKLKSKKKPYSNSSKKYRRQYYLLSAYDVLSVAEEKFLIHKQNAADEKIRTVKKIQIERVLGHEGQIIAAEKMVKGNNKKTDDFEINQCVVFGVPKVDMGTYRSPKHNLCDHGTKKKKDNINLEQNMVYSKDGSVAKNPCQSSRCACFKNNMQCNSRCHNQSSCKNK
ncbi:unnamed protein product [Macrosiphum euphorbiae]|uniref:Uncharacterized protein n=1 Tax=Macrosiphum euphorbiae TaxID=13131 RepID=A0AAV0WUF5_9HEMI|nr:unnamed protein product [Macrosiphum euphorbiae]